MALFPNIGLEKEKFNIVPRMYYIFWYWAHLLIATFRLLLEKHYEQKGILW